MGLKPRDAANAGVLTGAEFLPVDTGADVAEHTTPAHIIDLHTDAVTHLAIGAIPGTAAEGSHLHAGQDVGPVNSILYDNTPATLPTDTGSTFWDAVEGTISTRLDSGVTLQHGQETYFYGHAVGDIANGELCQFVSVQGDHITFKKAVAAEVKANPHYLIGVSTHPITSGEFGYITSFGKINGLFTATPANGDSASWVAGDVLYFDNVTGGLTKTEPHAPDIRIVVAVVIKAQTGASESGIILVRISRGMKLQDLDDVNGTPLTADGQLMVWDDAAGYFDATENIHDYSLMQLHTDTEDPTGFVDPDNIVRTYDSVTRTATLTAVSGTVDYYWRGVKKTLGSSWTSPTAHAATEGNWYLTSLDGTNFVWSTSPWMFDQVMVVYVHYDATNKFAISETHGCAMSIQTHEEAHDSIGAYKKAGGGLNGFALSSTTAADRRPVVASTTVKDEDLKTVLAELAVESYTRYHLTGASTAVFTPAQADIIALSTNQPYYNLFTGGVWTQAMMANNSYTCVWVVAVPTTSDTSSQAYRYLWVQGQSAGSLTSQQSLAPQNVSTGALQALATEFVFIGKIVVQYTAGNWTLTSVETLIGSNKGQVGTAAASYVSQTITDGNTITSPSEDAVYDALQLKANLVSPTFTTPNIGVAAGTSFNSITGLASVAPLMDGAPTVGDSTLAARQNHVHPSDTSRALNLLTGYTSGAGTVAATDTVLQAIQKLNGNDGIAASEIVAGRVELATAAETTTGTDSTRAVHPAGLKVELDKKALLAGSATQDFAAKTLTATTASLGTNSTQVATTAFVTNAIANSLYYGVSWNQDADTYARTGNLVGQPTGQTLAAALIPIQALMRRCTVLDSGVRNYYLSATNSNFQENGITASVLTGADGQVMVEIPKFYHRHTFAGSTHTWDISLVPLAGFTVHDAFVKDGVEVDYRYFGAYEASLTDTSTKLASISGATGFTLNEPYADGKIYINATRATFRAKAAARGTAWRQLDYDLHSAVQLLFLVEYASFNSQLRIGAGITNVTDWSTYNNYYPICPTGNSNLIGNATGNVGTASATCAVTLAAGAYMSYRGIENWYGHIWKWTDGINTNEYRSYVSNNRAVFADDTLVGYTDIGISNAAVNGYQNTLLNTGRGFLPATVGAASSTKLTDYYYTAAGWRVAVAGGSAFTVANTGGFYLVLAYAASYVSPDVGGRLAA